MNTEPIVIGIEANPSDFLADAKKIQSEMDILAHRLDKAGVSQSAYNKAVSNANQANKAASMSITDLHSAYMIVADVARFAGDVWEETGQKFVDNAVKVGDMARALGTTTEEASRIKEVADDVGISIEKLTSSFRVAQKDGFSPTIEGLARMSDQYLALAPGVERAQFLQDRFGKSGEEMGKLLEKGSQSIREQAAAMDEAMIVTQKAYEQARQFQISQDALNDSWDAFTYQVAPPLVEGLTSVINHYRDITTSLKENGYWYTFTHQLSLDDIAAKREQADAALLATEATDNMSAAFETEAEAAKNAEEAIREVSAANTELVGTVEKMQSTTENFAEQYQRINEDMSLSDDERKAKIAEVAAQEEEANRRIILAMLEKQLSIDGLDARETEYLLSKGQEWGIYSEEVIAAARDAQAEVMALTGEINAVPKQNTVTFDIITNGAPPNLDTSGTPAPVGTRKSSNGRKQHATGGEFMIPMSYGNEGFMMGNGDSASGGERVKITPPGGNNSDREMIELLRMIAAKPVVTEYTLSQAIRDVVVQVSK